MAAAITPTPNNGKVGSTTVVTGTGFATLSAVTFTFGGNPITPTNAPITTDGSGAFSANIVIPASVQGTHAIVATDASSGTASANFTTNPFLSLDPTHGPAGELITLKGTGFATVSAVTVQLDGNPITPTSAITTDSTGGFTNGITPLITLALGSHTITVTDASANTASATYTVDENGVTLVTLVNPGKLNMPFGIVDEVIPLGGQASYSVVAIIPVYNFTDAQIQLYNEDSSNTITYTSYGLTNFNNGVSPDPTLTSWTVIGTADTDIGPHASKLVTMTKPALWSWIMIQAKPKVANSDAVLDIYARLVKAIGQ